MSMRNILWAASVAAAVIFAGDGRASDLAGHAAVNLDIRSGPSARFPVVRMAAGGSLLTIHGCLARYTWCDVNMGGVRGWASGAHLQFAYGDRWVYVPAYAVQVEIPVVSFHVIDYWTNYYHDRDFYAEIDDWSRYHWEDDGLPPGWRDKWEDHVSDQ